MQSAGGVPIPTPTLPGTARKENERYRKGENKRKRERKREGKEWEDKLIQRDQNGRGGRKRGVGITSERYYSFLSRRENTSRC